MLAGCRPSRKTMSFLSRRCLFQRRGIGKEVMKRLMGEANEFNLAVRLNVVRINPARRLYERLGFRGTHEDDRKLYMKRDPGVAGL